MLRHIKTVRAWRESGLTYAAIQARCEKRGFLTQMGTVPTIKTLHLWCKGIPRPRKPPPPQREPKRAPPPGPPPPIPQSLIHHVITQVNNELHKLSRIKSWRDEGLSFSQIQAHCITHEIKSRMGTVPSISTLHRWASAPLPSSDQALNSIMSQYTHSRAKELRREVESRLPLTYYDPHPNSPNPSPLLPQNWSTKPR